MTTHEPATIDCPACAKSQVQEIWSSVNVTLDPALKTEVLHGRLNRFICSHCGERAMLTNELLYGDVDRRLLVAMAPETLDEALLASAAGVIATGLEGVRTRQVRTHNALVELIRLDDDGLDDRVFACVKEAVQLQHPAMRGDELLYDGVREGALAIAAIGEGPPRAFSVPRAMYDGLSERLEAAGLLASSTSWLVTDSAYSQRVLKILATGSARH